MANSDIWFKYKISCPFLPIIFKLNTRHAYTAWISAWEWIELSTVVAAKFEQGKSDSISY